MKKATILFILVLGFSQAFTQVRTDNPDSLNNAAQALLKKGKSQKIKGLIVSGVGIGMFSGAAILGRNTSFDSFTGVIFLGLAGAALTVTGIIFYVSGVNKTSKARIILKSDHLSMAPHQSKTIYSAGILIPFN